jgi:hypothetical protein
MKSRKMINVGHAAHMGEKTNAYRILVANSEGKRPFGRTRHIREDTIKMDLKK